MTEEGIPCLYYGTELDFAGGNDPANREVLWDSGFPTTGDTFLHFAKLSRIRRDYDAIMKGDTNVVYATTHTKDEGDAGIFAYERTGGDAGDQYALVVLNTNGRHDSVTSDGTTLMKVTKTNITLVDILNPEGQTFDVPNSGTLSITVPKQRAMVLVPQNQKK
jgi:glycosidase